MKKRIYVTYTGGTIGMKKSSQGWVPAPGYLQEQMQNSPVFRIEGMPEFTIHEFSPLLDSSNMTPQDWVNIAVDIKEHYSDYDGFVVLHGTDTMAYSASALAFMFEALAKPVIFTGSQVPLCEPRNDARENLIASLIIAADYPIPEICLYFDNMLFRGCRAVKSNSNAFAAFASPNFPALATTGININVNWNLVRKTPMESEALVVHERMDPSVGVLRLFPGITGAAIRNFLRPPLKGVVIQAYGEGNGPADNREVMAALEEANNRGLVIVALTQCWMGTVDLTAYATGLARVGAVSGYDMTPEAALGKLFYLFGKGYSPERVKELVTEDLRGELTKPSPDWPGKRYRSL
ncbi:MAG TPA: asparaginase [Candidatus Angelobacter sp.]|jgi:L-asparaginase|nr:asparaginase [Candidatus Angelobacter sp.]